jgi:hypothetical protein
MKKKENRAAELVVANKIVFKISKKKKGQQINCC